MSAKAKLVMSSCLAKLNHILHLSGREAAAVSASSCVEPVYMLFWDLFMPPLQNKLGDETENVTVQALRIIPTIPIRIVAVVYEFVYSGTDSDLSTVNR